AGPRLGISRAISLSQYSGRGQGEGSIAALSKLATAEEPSPQPSPGIPGEGVKQATPTVVEEWWAVSASEPKEQYNIIARERAVSVQAMLGLTRGASRISRIADVIGREKFVRLTNGEQNIIYMSGATARELNVAEN